MTRGRLAVSAINPVAIMNASAAVGENRNLNKMAITIGVSNKAAPSLAKNAEMTAPSKIIKGNKIDPRPHPKRATCNTDQPKKPAASKINEMIISATKVKVRSETMSQTMGTSDQCKIGRASCRERKQKRE